MFNHANGYLYLCWSFLCYHFERRKFLISVFYYYEFSCFVFYHDLWWKVLQLRLTHIPRPLWPHEVNVCIIYVQVLVHFTWESLLVWNRLFFATSLSYEFSYRIKYQFSLNPQLHLEEQLCCVCIFTGVPALPITCLQIHQLWIVNFIL